MAIIFLGIFFQSALSGGNRKADVKELQKCRFVCVVDGDTIKVKDDDGKEVSVRMFGIDAPESIVSDRRNHFCRLIFDFKKPDSTEDDVSVKGDIPSANVSVNHKGQPHIAPVKPQSTPVIAPVILGAIPQRIVDEIKKDRKINYNKLSCYGLALLV
jgi:hypothetical protein